MRVAPETVIAALGLAVCGAAVATVAGGGLQARLVAGAASALALVLPVSSALRTWLLDLFLDRGDTVRAALVARRALDAARRPRSRARAAMELALVHLAAGESGAAVPLLEEARGPLDGEERAGATALLAIARVHVGEANGALDLAREAHEALSDDPLAAYALGLALLASGDAALALPHLTRGVADPDAALLPSPGERSFALGRAHAALGDSAAAKAAFTAAARSRPPGPFTRRADEKLRLLAGNDLPA